VSYDPGAAKVTKVTVNIPDGGANDLVLDGLSLSVPPAGVTAWQHSGDDLVQVALSYRYRAGKLLVSSQLAASLTIMVIHT